MEELQIYNFILTVLLHYLVKLQRKTAHFEVNHYSTLLFYSYSRSAKCLKCLFTSSKCPPFALRHDGNKHFR